MLLSYGPYFGLFVVVPHSHTSQTSVSNDLYVVITICPVSRDARWPPWPPRHHHHHHGARLDRVQREWRSSVQISGEFLATSSNQINTGQPQKNYCVYKYCGYIVSLHLIIICQATWLSFFLSLISQQQDRHHPIAIWAKRALDLWWTMMATCG